MGEPRFVVVLDFEANCSDKEKNDHEIVEFPAVLIDCEAQKTVSEFHHYVQMIKHDHLSDFIKTMTHITDEQVSQGMIWSDCLVAFEEWLSTAMKEHNFSIEETVVLCCGSWDIKTMLPKQLENTGTRLSPLLTLLFGRWHNIKKSFAKKFNMGRQQGMDGMLKHFDIALDGHHHSGIDDTRNISKLALHWLSNNVSLSANCLHEAPFYYYSSIEDMPYKRDKKGLVLLQKPTTQ